jgi:hypothetical protein
MTVIAGKENVLWGLSGDIFQTQVSLLQAQKVRSHIFGVPPIWTCEM